MFISVNKKNIDDKNDISNKKNIDDTNDISYKKNIDDTNDISYKMKNKNIIYSIDNEIKKRKYLRNS